MAQNSHHEEVATLRRRGYRLTPQRLSILGVVKTRSEHLSAEAIHAGEILGDVGLLERYGLEAP